MNTSEKTPSFSIIVAVRDQAEALQSYLTALAVQQYADFQIVVVDESSTDNTSDLLSNLRENNPRLYGTFVPQYHFQRNLRRLALTIGIKAAKGEWVVFADVDGFQPSQTWLSELSKFAVSPHQLLLGYVRHKTGDVQLKPFDDLRKAQSLIAKTEQRRLSGGGRLFGILHHDYDFLVVRHDLGHELLRLFESTKQHRL